MHYGNNILLNVRTASIVVSVLLSVLLVLWFCDKTHGNTKKWFTVQHRLL